MLVHIHRCRNLKTMMVGGAWGGGGAGGGGGHCYIICTRNFAPETSYRQDAFDVRYSLLSVLVPKFYYYYYDTDLCIDNV